MKSVSESYTAPPASFMVHWLFLITGQLFFKTCVFRAIFKLRINTGFPAKALKKKGLSLSCLYFQPIPVQTINKPKREVFFSSMEMLIFWTFSGDKNTQTQSSL